MVHVFKYKTYNYIYDTGSASLHECDDKTAKYLSARVRGESPALSEEDARAISADVQTLIGEGLLYAEEPKVCPAKSSEVKALCIHICHDCNLRCRYCFADEGAYHARREFMSEQTAKRAIDFLIENSGSRKILEADFFGGEPLMCLPVIKSVVEYARRRGEEAGKKFLFTTTTNAVLLDDDATDFLNSEMENVVLSLDGRPEVHNAIRKTVSGKGSFEAVFPKIQRFVASRGDKSYYVRGTFTAKNLDFSNDVMFLAESGFDSISMEPVVTDIPDLKIGEEHLPRICEEYEVLTEKYLQAYRQGRGFNFFHFNIDLEGGPCLSKRVSACGAGNEYFSVVPDGSIFPCHQFAGNQKFLMGGIYGGVIDGKIRKSFATSCLFTRRGCEGCFAKFICSGGCSANNYNFCGNIEEPYVITCAMMKKRTECAMHILAEKKRMENE